MIKARFVYRGTTDPFGRAPRFNAASAPPALLETNAAGSAAAQPAAGCRRRGAAHAHRLAAGLAWNRDLVPGMAAEVMRVAGGASDITMISNEHDPLSFLSGIGLSAAGNRDWPVPTDAARANPAALCRRHVPTVLNPGCWRRESLRGAIVLVGAQGQVVKTPLGPSSVANVMAEGRGEPSERPGA